MLNDVIAALLIGLLGAGHCLAMCGGISGAIAHASKGQHTTTVPLFYNLGRITSYSLIGFLAGLSAEIGVNYGGNHTALVVLRFVSGATLIFIGLYIAQLNSSILKLEKIGRYLWRYIQPIAQRFMPLKTPLHAFPLGFFWGWLPCGLVYSALTLSLASGSALKGSLIMFGFGLGTFPMMFLVGKLSDRFNQILQNSKFKWFSGMLLVLFGSHVIYIAMTQLGDHSF